MGRGNSPLNLHLMENKFKIRKEPLGIVACEFNSGEVYEIDENEFEVNLTEEDLKNCLIVDNRSTDHKELGAPLTLVVYPTYDCNVRCKFCYVYTNPKPSKRIISDETISSIFKYVKDKGISHIDILGGEPFLPKVKKQTKKIIQLGLEDNLRVYVSTNGQLLKKDDLLFLKDCHLKNPFFEVAFSIHGTQQIHDNLMGSGTYDRIMKNLEWFEKNGISFIISTTIDKSNIHSLIDLFQDLKKFQSFKSWIFNYPPISPKMMNGYKNPLVTEVYNIIKQLYNDSIEIIGNIPFTYKIENTILPNSKVEKIFTGCSGGRTKMEISPEGDVYPCAYLIDIPKFNMGNLNDKTFDWNKFKDRNFWKVIPPSCNSKCDYFEICTGCLAHSYFLNKKYDDRCQYQESTTANNVYN